MFKHMDWKPTTIDLNYGSNADMQFSNNMNISKILCVSVFWDLMFVEEKQQIWLNIWL